MGALSPGGNWGTDLYPLRSAEEEAWRILDAFPMSPFLTEFFDITGLAALFPLLFCASTFTRSCTVDFSEQCSPSLSMICVVGQWLQQEPGSSIWADYLYCMLSDETALETRKCLRGLFDPKLIRLEYRFLLLLLLNNWNTCIEHYFVALLNELASIISCTSKDHTQLDIVYSFKSKWDLIRGSDIHSHETSCRDKYRTGRHKTLACDILSCQAEFSV